MPPWSHRLIAEFTAADAWATRLAQPLTAPQLNWRPHPGEWSVGQCLEHLAVSNELYLRAIEGALSGRAPAPVQEITPGWFGRWFIRNYIAPSVTMKRRAPKRIRPAVSVDRSILDRFLGSNEIAREVVARAQEYDVNRIRFKNPFVGVMRFTLGTGLEILSQHERRHLLQAERVRQAPGFPLAM